MEQLERLQQLEQLQRLERLQQLEVSNISYEEYEYIDGDIVYCDVPYEVIGKNNCNDYGVTFDSLKFYDWAKNANFPVYFSSYEISDKSFYKKKLKTINSLMSATENRKKVVEYIYSNREF